MISTLSAATYNLYLGADLLPLLGAAGDDTALAAAAHAVRAQLLASRPADRAARAADLIAREAPDVVGLQEAITLRTPLGELDLVAVLVEALAAHGLAYRTAERREAFAGGSQTLRLAGHDVLLVRDRPGLEVTGTDRGGFAAGVPLPAPQGGIVEAGIHRGWVSVDLRVETEAGTQALRLVSTHLEAHDDTVNTAQAAELAALVASSDREVVLVGDLNARPGRYGAGVLTAAGFRDAWELANPGRDGFTCGQDADLRNPTTALDHRIDYVLVGPGRPVTAARVFGADPADRLAPDDDEPPLWPSDHAGVVAVLAF